MVPAIAPMISTASSTTANLSEAKKRKTELRCQLGREMEADEPMRWAAILREKLHRFNARVHFLRRVPVIGLDYEGVACPTRFCPVPRGSFSNDRRKRSRRTHQVSLR